MEREFLSKNSTFGKIISFLFLATIAFLLESIMDVGFFLITCAALIIIGYVLFFLPDTIEFDAENMYIKKNDSEVVVDLKDIYKIKITQAEFNRVHTWKVKYKVNGVDKAARFYLNNSTSFEVFKNRVKIKNPNVEISNWTSTVDFDI